MNAHTSNFGKKGLEGLFVLVLVLLAYLAILSLLTNAFPSGASLKQVVGGNSILAKLNFLGNEDKLLKFSNNSYDLDLRAGQEYFAAIIEKTNIVKAKGADSVAWGQARKGLRLGNQDAVQTFSRSSAVIQIDDDSYIDMGENSLIVINRMEDDQLLEEKRTRVVMLAGELRGSITAANNQAIQLEVATGKAQTKVISSAGMENTRFSIKVNPDRSSTITVLEGNAEIRSGDQHLILERNSAVVIDEDSTIQQPQRIPGRISIDKPADNAQFFYKDFPGNITFDWIQEDDADEYQIVLARDHDFKHIVFDKTTDKSYFSHNNLKAGTYYWKVRGIRNVLQGDFTIPRTLQISQDNIAPPLLINMRDKSTTAGKFSITGSTEPSAIVFINNQPVKVKASGKFNHTIKLKKGVNIIVVEALDRAGNTTYESKNIYAN